MKKIPFFALAVSLIHNLAAQNVGIGTTEPQNKLQVHGSLLVTVPVSSTSTPPTAGQTHTLINGNSFNFQTSDATGRVYDPGGPAGNYLANLTANAFFPGLTNPGVELTVESMDLGTGDSLIIKSSATGTTLMAVGNGYTITGKWVFNSSSVYLLFKSNADGNTGAGFSLLLKKLQNESSMLQEADGFVGNTFFFDVKTGVFRSGTISNALRGDKSVAMGSSAVASAAQSVAIGTGVTASGIFSVAMGYNTIASANFSTAIGSETGASGETAVAMGNNTIASGSSSTSMGSSTTASGIAATAMGSSTIASGNYSTAMGRTTIANGNYSTAMGSYVSTNNFDGALIIGDNSTTTILNIATANSFRARFDGGYRFFTSAAAINAESCQLPAGGNAWVTASDSRLKEKITIADGEDFLKKIATMKLGSWNYLSQNPLKQRHYGPMAQDFYAAFGKDEFGTIGNDTTINSADFDGVNLIAIQALEKRTQKIEQLEKENNALKQQQQITNKEIEDIKTKLLKLEIILSRNQK
ncbi:MAG: hypothetical protein HOP10_12920 [Chitinophagaceae bacterium]|nr:hypothetical protein [Chitinophagaceae bacterium]